MIQIIRITRDMIESTKLREKYDRLTAFLRTYDLRTEIVPEGHMADAQLFISTDPQTGAAYRIDLAMRGGLPPAEGAITAARVIFGGVTNPLIAALPERITLTVADEPALRGTADLFVDEAQQPRCGGATVQSRLGEVIVVLAIRRAIERHAVGAGLLAGLAHPTLHRPLVAMHDDPGRAWRMAELSALAEMSRGHFVARFRAVVGQSPAAYLTAWRLTLGRHALASGHSVKTTAHQTGFGSAAAFSHAFSRHFGHAPGRARHRGV